MKKKKEKEQVHIIKSEQPAPPPPPRVDVGETSPVRRAAHNTRGEPLFLFCIFDEQKENSVSDRAALPVTRVLCVFVVLAIASLGWVELGERGKDRIERT